VLHDHLHFDPVENISQLVQLFGDTYKQLDMLLRTVFLQDLVVDLLIEANGFEVFRDAHIDLLLTQLHGSLLQQVGHALTHLAVKSVLVHGAPRDLPILIHIVPHQDGR
jgi:hypothetical protein